MSVSLSLSNRKKILIVGGDSNIGRELFFFLSLLDYDVTRTTRNYLALDSSFKYLDLEIIESFKEIQTNYDFVIFCAALTSVSKCDEFPTRAYSINYYNTFLLAEKFIDNGCFTIFFSSSLVFSGLNKIEYVESTTHPITVYGKTKDLLEKKLLHYGKSVSIIRSTKIIFKNFELFDNWVDLLLSGNAIYPFKDIYFAPISIEYLLNCIEEIIKSKISGLNHVSPKNDLLYLDAAFYIADKLKLNKNLIIPKDLCETNIKYCPKFSLLESNLFEFKNLPLPELALDYYLLSKV